MLQWWKKRVARRALAQELYQVALRQSREPLFYQRLAIPDNTDGHFDLLSLHIFMMMNRLQDLGRDGKALSQSLFDAFFRRMELDLREMGIGDMGVPRHMKRMMTGFNGRAFGLKKALMEQGQAADLAVQDFICRNLYHGVDVPQDVMAAWVAYIQRNVGHFEQYGYDVFEARTIRYEPIMLPEFSQDQNEQVSHG